MAKPKRASNSQIRKASELVIITGLSGSGKATVLKALEDLGYYAVDNLPIGLLPKFAELAKDSLHVRRAALVIDIREGQKLVQFPAIFRRLRRQSARDAAVSRSRRSNLDAALQRNPASSPAWPRFLGA